MNIAATRILVRIGRMAWGMVAMMIPVFGSHVEAAGSRNL